MNRRSFFRSLAAAVAGTVVLPPAITYDRCWKYPSYKKTSGIWVVNPEWINAPYEIEFSLAPGCFERIVPTLFKRGAWNEVRHAGVDRETETHTVVYEPFPLRCNTNILDTKNPDFIPPWIEI